MSDAPPLIVTVRGGNLVPAGKIAQRMIAEHHEGTTLRVRVTRPRSHPHLAKWWVLCGKIAEAIGPSITAELISDTLKLRTGHAHLVKTAREILKFPKSIAFDKLSQDDFNALYERALVIITEDFLPGVKPSQLRDEIEGLVAA